VLCCNGWLGCFFASSASEYMYIQRKVLDVVANAARDGRCMEEGSILREGALGNSQSNESSTTSLVQRWTEM
jgi:hypothetical protein